MAFIEDFPQSLLDEHASWHRNMRRGNGLEFLEFHRRFLDKALDWYQSKGLDPQLVRPWSSIPSEIKNHPRWNRRLQDAENRIVNSLESFNSPDELGLFLQASSLHGAVHVLGSMVYNDPDFAQIFLSPRSTYFYNWHGLIDKWFSELER